jgi:hypothetical protein
MQRAAVLIGVSRSGRLPVLPAVIPSVKAMEKWALEQGIRPELVRTLTDEAGPLEPGPIKAAIRDIIDLAIVDQLIVYFAGHGVNIRYGEYWLLSAAPADPQAAVNVAGSVELARFCGIPHVIFFSDACRTAPEGIQAQYVSGSDIFPNSGSGGLENSVDLFFACTLGRPAHEVRDPASSATAFRAIYTEALVSALSGRHIDIVVPEDSPPGVAVSGLRTGVVRPRKLKEHLRREVVEKLRLSGAAVAVYQEPDGRITSEEDAWVSRVPYLTRRSIPRGEPEPSETLQDASEAVLQEALRSHGQPEALLQDLGRRVPGADEFEHLVQGKAQAFGPDHYETDCGFKIRGSRCTAAFAQRFGTDVLGDRPELKEQLVRVNTRVNAFGDGPPPRVDNVLLTFEDGASVVLPAIPDFLATVSVDNGEVTDVSYEPSATSSRWESYRDRMEELRLLRSVVASAAYLGVFKLKGEDAPALARRMQVAKGVDPTMSLYAAYAYRDLGARSRIREMHAALQSDLGFSLFDVAMLAGDTDRGTDRLPYSGTSPGIVPFVPLLSPGWSLLTAHNVQLPASLEDLKPHLHQSLWTSFDPAGASIIRTAMESEVRI